MRSAGSRSSLQTRLAISMSIFSWVATVLVMAGVYLYNRQQVREDARQRLLETVSLAVQRLDGDLHATLVESSQQGSEDYLRFQGWLQEIRDTNPDLTFVYTLRYDARKNLMIFIVDAETDPESASYLGDEYTELDPVLLGYLASLNTPAVSAQPYTDRWGTWLSAYAPIRTSNGKVDAVLGIDMSLQTLLAYENRLLWVSLGLLALVTPLMLWFGSWLGRRLANPITQLTQNAESIAKAASTYQVGTEQPLASIQTLSPVKQNAPLETLRLAAAFNMMTSQINSLVDSLEQRVNERTRAVELHSQYLRTTAELSQRFSIILDPDELIKQAVEQICGELDLYFVGLFLVDEGNQWAVLKAAANSPAAKNAAQLLLERELRLLIPAGMVGWCISQRRPRIAQAARQDELRLADPELPATLSEAALPLQGRRGVIGALNLHSDRLEAFDDQIIAMLTTLSNLLGIAIENARAYKALSERATATSSLEMDVDRFGPRTWQRLFQERPGWGYRYDEQQVDRISLVQGKMDTWFNEALRSQGPVHTADGRLIIPVWVRDSIIGAVSFKRASAGQSDESEVVWRKDEISILQEVMNDLGQALESARLYQETQRRALREQLTGQITARMRASLDLESILQTAVREIGERLRTTNLGVTLQNNDVNQGTGTESSSDGGGIVVEVHLGEEDNYA